jgi:hypothetical protein
LVHPEYDSLLGHPLRWQPLSRSPLNVAGRQEDVADGAHRLADRKPDIYARVFAYAKEGFGDYPGFQAD